MSQIVIRDLASITEFSQAEALQLSVWGEGDRPDPADLMMVIQHEGGLAAGAFLDDSLVGYVFGFPTREQHVQHSHRLAVHESGRGLGLATKLKWYQRDWCLARGISLVRWTFDPLRHVNANLNINRLGATVSTYFEDYYGEMDGINKGAPSDRILAEWQLNSARVNQRASGESQNLTPPQRTVQAIEIHSDFGQLLLHEPELALRERLRVRALLKDSFAAGFIITGFEAKSCAYLLEGKGDFA